MHGTEFEMTKKTLRAEFSVPRVFCLCSGIFKNLSQRTVISFRYKNDKRCQRACREPSCQKATALAAATFRESTPLDMGMRTV